MEDNKQFPMTVLDSSLQERIELVRQDVEELYAAMQEMVKDPSPEKLAQLRDKAFEHAEDEFELGFILSRINKQAESSDEDEIDLEEGDFDWADDQEMFVLLEEALELLKGSAELLARMKKYRKHILLELDEYGELPRALSGLHDALLERLEKLADVRNDF